MGEEGRTEMKAVRAMETRGTMSTSCSDATSSSSAGASAGARDAGRAMPCGEQRWGVAKGWQQGATRRGGASLRR